MPIICYCLNFDNKKLRRCRPDAVLTMSGRTSTWWTWPGLRTMCFSYTSTNLMSNHSKLFNIRSFTFLHSSVMVAHSALP